MSSFNQWTGIGNLGRDPETRYLPNGDAVANVSIACNEKWKDKNGDQQESVEWVRLTFWRRLAEIVDEYLKKGDQIFVQGKLVTRSYEKDGVTHYTTEVHVTELRMLGSKREGGEPARAAAQPAQATGQSAKKKPADDFEDDIPF
jgi:single-strand DNA-binding protein